jgi:hypothetical protein
MRGLDRKEHGSGGALGKASRFGRFYFWKKSISHPKLCLKSKLNSDV